MSITEYVKIPRRSSKPFYLDCSIHVKDILCLSTPFQAQSSANKQVKLVPAKLILYAELVKACAYQPLILVEPCFNVHKILKFRKSTLS